MHLHYDPWLSTGWERADAFVQALLRPAIDRLVVHIYCGRSRGTDMYIVGQWRHVHCRLW